MDYTAILPITHAKFFKPSDMVSLLSQIESNPKQAQALAAADLHDPQMVLLISLFVGWLGIDRLFLGQYLIGALKLITLGGWGIWWIIDLLTVFNRTKTMNYKTALQYLASAA